MGFGGSFVGAITLIKIGFNIVLMKRLYKKTNKSLSHDMERRKVRYLHLHANQSTSFRGNQTA